MNKMNTDTNETEDDIITEEDVSNAYKYLVVGPNQNKHFAINAYWDGIANTNPNVGRLRAMVKKMRYKEAQESNPELKAQLTTLKNTAFSRMNNALIEVGENPEDLNIMHFENNKVPYNHKTITKVIGHRTFGENEGNEFGKVIEFTVRHVQGMNPKIGKYSFPYNNQSYATMYSNQAFEPIRQYVHSKPQLAENLVTNFTPQAGQAKQSNLGIPKSKK